MRLGDLGSKSIALHGAALTLIVRILRCGAPVCALAKRAGLERAAEVPG
jgi:hypothetical protein